MLRASQCFMEGGGIREVKVGLVGGTGKVGIIEYKTSNGRWYSILEKGAIDKVLICICNCLLAMTMCSKIVRVVSGGGMSGTCRAVWRSGERCGG